MAALENRPKINIPKTKSEKGWDFTGYFCFFCSIVFLLLTWSALPEQVPAHYNAAGEVDRMGSKWELLILPGIGVFIILLMTLFEKFPEIHNYPKRLNESNAARFYRHSRKMVNQLKNICLIMFAFLLVESISIALGWREGAGEWMLPIILIGVFTPIVTGMVKQRKIE
ncbi:DUF1648 domain-containing protein [Salibacterium qingdaonense]|uniref:DUF1648 domain-containing protein n=1 Tax=Salibacterium qingdaonense TaxID=266892 RepID=A0A1I4MCZ2_9BACI|nr:DUF1648 domain-containing protein [Salibacterium qingdaonense]SFM00837.1 Protein of unknown function [Salibacterium qingdaonense]